MLSRQDFQTTIRELDGRTVEKVALRTSTPSAGGEASVVVGYLKVKSGNWHRFVLDAGILFWTEMKEPDADDLDAAAWSDADQAQAITEPDLDGAKIEGIQMKQHEGHGQLRIRTNRGVLVLESRGEGTEEEQVLMRVEQQG